MAKIFGRLGQKAFNLAVSPLDYNNPTTRDVALTVGGFAAGGPAGAAAGHGLATAMNNRDASKDAAKSAQAYQDEQTAAISKNNKSLIQALAKDDSKTQSLQYRANRSRSASGLLGGTVTTTEKGPSATLG